jgi:hypothetical protein
VFVHALNTVKKLPRTGSAKPPPEDRLKLYGLYKQSMGTHMAAPITLIEGRLIQWEEGDVAGVMARPAGTTEEQLTEQKKWCALTFPIARYWKFQGRFILKE